MNRRPYRTIRLLVVAGLFAAVAVAASVTDPEVARVPVPRIEFGANPSPPASVEPETEAPRADRPPTGTGAGLGWLAGLGLLVLLGLGVWLLWRTMQDRATLRQTTPPARAGEPEHREQVRAAVAATLDELAADDADPRSAVIGCWLRLERVAADAGVRRRPADTSADLVARMLAAYQVSERVLDRFAAVYREARYAPHEIGPVMRDEARNALERVHAELSADTRLVDPAGSGTGEAAP